VGVGYEVNQGPNANGVDLSSDFPWIDEAALSGITTHNHSTNPPQPETQAIIKFKVNSNKIHFVTGITFRGWVCNCHLHQ
jgi:hypothetical protein